MTYIMEAAEIERLRQTDAVWRQKYNLLESQIANCHKEIRRLRNELLRYSAGDDPFSIPSQPS